MIEKFRIQVSRIFVIIIIITIAFSSSIWDAKLPVVSALFFLIGCILTGIASLGRLWCSLYIAGYKTTVLVTEGPYSISRNPLYFFSLLGGVGVGFASESLLVPFIIFCAFAFYYPVVIKSEEAEMLKMHGDQFVAYCRNVPRFFPNLSKLKEPEQYVVNPIIFKKHLFDALWFVWLVGILEFIETLHEVGFLPILFTIY